MISRILVPALFALALALPAAAAPGSSSGQSGMNPTPNDRSSAQPTPKIAAKLRDSLTQAGFTDIHLMPESFLVRAKDKDGNPVMMVVNPDSVTSITALGASSNGNMGTTGNGTNGGSSGGIQQGPNGTTKE